MTRPDPPSRWKVVAVPAVRRHLRTLPEAVSAALYEFVDGPLRDNPHRIGRPLRGPFAGLHAAHRGHYRIVYRIDDDRRTVVVHRVAHRRDAYRSDAHRRGPGPTGTGPNGTGRK
ncbi:MAG TPA: type II toxin-antitoxin system RelE/ParE family toxin [Acidimicrobiales bacterium]|nr:type II toxin-antitoxin system RelE/ParE family toxin [Acidimicrobiales bacterium]